MIYNLYALMINDTVRYHCKYECICESVFYNDYVRFCKSSDVVKVVHTGYINNKCVVTEEKTLEF